MNLSDGGTGAPPVIPLPPDAGFPPGRLDPWFSIWVAPRGTLRQILDSTPRRSIHLIVILTGLVAALGLPFFGSLPAPIDLPLPLMTAAAAVAVPIALLVYLYVAGWLLTVIGRWFGGRGDSTAVRAAIAWSQVPAVWAGLLLIPQYILMTGGVWPSGLAEGEFPDNLLAVLLVGFIGILKIALGVWQLVIFMKCLGEAHHFSAWHAFGATFLMGLLVGIPLGILITAFTLLR